MNAIAKHDKIKKHYHLLCTVIALFAFCAFFCNGFQLDSSARGKTVSIIPDAVEYVYAPLMLINTGHYSIPLNNELHPSRYLPWYSLLFIAPFQKLSQTNGAVLGVWAGNLLFILSFFFSVFAVTGRKSYSICALLLLIFNHRLLALTGVAMTEFPYMALSSLLLLLFISLYTNQSYPAIWKIELLGIVGALAGAMRSSGYLLLLLPAILIFIRSKTWSKRIQNLALFGIWAFFLICLTMFYNNAIFGSPFRSGYHYWCPVPYEIPGLTFSPRFLFSNLRTMFHEGWFWCAFLGFCIILTYLICRIFKCTEKSAVLDAAAIFAVSHSLILFFLYSAYFFYDERFFLPGVVTAIPPVLGILRTFFLFLKAKFPIKLSIFPPIRIGFPVAALIILLFTLFSGYSRIPMPHSDAYAAEEAMLDLIDRTIPDDAVFLSPFLPVKTDYSINLKKRRTVIPYSRKIEYANKIIALEPIDCKKLIPLPTNPIDHLAPVLLHADGCRYACSLVLDENRDLVPDLLSSGKRVFFVLRSLRETPPFSYHDSFKLTLVKKVGNMRIIEVTQNNLL